MLKVTKEIRNFGVSNLRNTLREAGERVYRVDGGFIVDSSRRFVRGPDSEIHLRRKTFKVLDALIENRDRALSKDELMANVWHGTAVTDDVLVTSITEIRRAFGDDPRAPTFIKTIHGTGYRWIASVAEAAPEVEVEDDRESAPVAGSAPKLAAVAAALLAVVSAGGLSLRNTGMVEHESEVAWWRFDESAGNAVADSSGYGNAGRIYSGVERVPGRLGGALRFNGLGDGIAGKAGGSIPIGNSPRTIAAWVKTDSTNGDFTNLFHYGLNGSQPPAANFALVLTPDGRIRSGNGFHSGYVTGQSPIDDGSWHSVAAVYEGAASNLERIYIDGREDVSGRLNGPPATINGGTWTIGKFLGGGTRFLGTLDDIRVFDRALRPAEVQALFRCSSGITDVKSPTALYYLPVMGGMTKIEDGEIKNTGLDVSGIQLAKSDSSCAVESLNGAAIGQDLYLSAELKTPAGPNSLRTEAGIHFRSRRAHAGDGIHGGTSAGYWVRLRSGGQVTVGCLNPGQVVAFTNVPDLAPDEYHRLEVTALGTTLEASLDGNLLEFTQDGHRTTRVTIPPLWQGPPKLGHNDGTVGVAFTAELNRGRLGGQSARNFVVRPGTKFLSSR
jgi:DNA-binding winged helix-turn-helix (wHTH) protein